MTLVYESSALSMPTHRACLPIGKACYLIPHPACVDRTQCPMCQYYAFKIMETQLNLNQPDMLRHAMSRCQSEVESRRSMCLFFFTYFSEMKPKWQKMSKVLRANVLYT